MPLKSEKHPLRYASDVDHAESECRELAEDFQAMTDFMFSHEWVANVLEILMRRGDLSARDIALLLISVRERYRKCPARYNMIAHELSKLTGLNEGAM
jgi:hypothetical protein